MTVTSVKIDNKKYRIISEEEYLNLLQDISDLKKIFKRSSEKGIEARDFFAATENKQKSAQ
ncbi:MAG: hypothetical protein H7257_04590 [Taibaiella sp.]|nr:hypothetical protein [Taibaiella sp.]